MSDGIRNKNICKHVLTNIPVPNPSANVHMSNGKKKKQLSIQNPKLYGKPKHYDQCVIVAVNKLPDNPTDVPPHLWKTEKCCSKPSPLHPKESTFYTKNSLNNISSKGQESTLIDKYDSILVIHNHLRKALKTPIFSPKLEQLNTFSIKTSFFKQYRKVDDMESRLYPSFSNMLSSRPQGQAKDTFFKIANQTPNPAVLSDPPPTYQQEVTATYEQLNDSLIIRLQIKKNFSKHYQKVDTRNMLSRKSQRHTRIHKEDTDSFLKSTMIKYSHKEVLQTNTLFRNMPSGTLSKPQGHALIHKEDFIQNIKFLHKLSSDMHDFFEVFVLKKQEPLNKLVGIKTEVLVAVSSNDTRLKLFKDTLSGAQLAKCLEMEKQAIGCDLLFEDQMAFQLSPISCFFRMTMVINSPKMQTDILLRNMMNSTLLKPQSWFSYLRFFEQHFHQSAQAPSIEKNKSPLSKGNWPQYGQPSFHTLYCQKSKQSVFEMSEPPTKKVSTGLELLSSKVLKKKVCAMVIGASPTERKTLESSEPKIPCTHPHQDTFSSVQLANCVDVDKQAFGCDLHTGFSLAFRLSLPSCFFRMTMIGLNSLLQTDVLLRSMLSSTFSKSWGHILVYEEAITIRMTTNSLMHNLLRNMLSSILSRPQGHTLVYEEAVCCFIRTTTTLFYHLRNTQRKHTESLIHNKVDPQTPLMVCLQKNVLAPTQDILKKVSAIFYPVIPNPSKVKQTTYLTVNSKASICKLSLQPSSCSVTTALVNVMAITLYLTDIQPNRCPVGRKHNQIRAKRQKSSSSSSNSPSITTLGSRPVSGIVTLGDGTMKRMRKKKRRILFLPHLKLKAIRFLDLICCSGNMNFRVRLGIFEMLTLMSHWTLYLGFFEQHSQSAQVPSIEREKSPPSKGNWPHHGQPSYHTLYWRKSTESVFVQKQISGPLKKKGTAPKILQNEQPTCAMVTGASPTAFKGCKTLESSEPKLPYTHPHQDTLSGAQLAKCLEMEKQAIGCDLHLWLWFSEHHLAFRLSCLIRMAMTVNYNILLRNMTNSILSKLQEHTESLIHNPQTTVILFLQANVLASTQAILNNLPAICYPVVPNPSKVKHTTYLAANSRASICKSVVPHPSKVKHTTYLAANSRASICKSSLQPSKTVSCSVTVALVNVKAITLYPIVIQPNSCSVGLKHNWVRAKRQKSSSSSSNSHTASSTILSSTLGSTPVSGGGRDDEEDEEEEKKNPLPPPPGINSFLLHILIRIIDLIGNMDFRVLFGIFEMSHWTLYLRFFKQHSQSAQAPNIEREKFPPSKGNWPQHTLYWRKSTQSVSVRKQISVQRTQKGISSKASKNDHNMPPTCKKNVGAMVTGASPTAFKGYKTSESIESELPFHPHQDILSGVQRLEMGKQTIGCHLHTRFREYHLAFQLSLPSCFFRMAMTVNHNLLLKNMPKSILSKLQEHAESLIDDPQTTVMLCLQGNVLVPTQAILNNLPAICNPVVPNPSKVKQTTYLAANSRASICKSSLQPSKTVSCSFTANVKAITLYPIVIEPNSCPVDRKDNRVLAKRQKSSFSSSNSHTSSSTTLSSTLGSRPVSGIVTLGDGTMKRMRKRKTRILFLPHLELKAIRFIDLICCSWKDENMNFRVRLGIFEMLTLISHWTLYLRFFKQHSQSAQAPSIERESKGNWPHHGQPSSHTLHWRKSTQSVSVRKQISGPRTKKGISSKAPKNLQNEHNTPPTCKNIVSAMVTGALPPPTCKNIVSAMVTGALPTGHKTLESSEPKLPYTHPQQDIITLSGAQLAKCLEMEKQAIGCDLHTGFNEDHLTFRLGCFFMTVNSLLHVLLLSSTLSKPQEHTESLINNEVDQQTTVMLGLQENVLAPIQAMLNNLRYPVVSNPSEVKQSRRTIYLVAHVNSKASVCKVSLQPSKTLSCSVIYFTVIQPNSCPVSRKDNRVRAKRQKSSSSSSNSQTSFSTTLESFLLSILIRIIDFICFVVCSWKGGNMDFRVCLRVTPWILCLRFFEQHSQSAQAPREKSPPSKGNWPQHGRRHTLCWQKSKQSVSVRQKISGPTIKKGMSSKAKNLQNKPPTCKKSVGAIVCVSPTALKERETLETSEPKLPLHQDIITPLSAQLAKCLEMEIGCNLRIGFSEDHLAFRLSLLSCFFRMAMTVNSLKLLLHNLLKNMLSNTFSKPQEYTESLIHNKVDPQTALMLCFQENVLVPTQAVLNNLPAICYPSGPNASKVKQSRTALNSRASTCKLSLQPSKTLSCSVNAALKVITPSPTVTQPNSCPVGRKGNRVRTKQQKSSSSSSNSHAATLSSTLGSTPISSSDSGGRDDEEEENKNPLPLTPGIESFLQPILIIDFICFLVCSWKGGNMDFRVCLEIFEMLWRVTLMSHWTLYLRFFKQHSQSAQAPSIERESKENWPHHGQPSSHTPYWKKSKQSVSVRKQISEPPTKKDISFKAPEYNTPPTSNKKAMVTCALPTALKGCKTLESSEPKLPYTHPQQDIITLSGAQLAKCLEMKKQAIGCNLHTGFNEYYLAFRLSLPSCFFRMAITVNFELLHNLNMPNSILSKLQEHTDPQTTVMLCFQENVLVPTQAILNNLPAICNPLCPTVIQPNSCPVSQKGNRVRAKRQKSSSSSSNSHTASSTNLSSTLGSTSISGSDSGGRDDEEDEEEEKKNPLPPPPGIENFLLICIINFICFVVCLWRGENMDFRVRLGIFEMLWRVMSSAWLSDHSTSSTIAAETEPPDLPQVNSFFEHSDDPPYTPDPSQTSEDDDLSGSAPNPISVHSSDHPEADQQQSTITTRKASNDLDSTSHLSPKVSSPPRKSSVVNSEEPSSEEFETSDHFKPPDNRKYTGEIVTLSLNNQSIHPTAPISKLQQRVHNAGPHEHDDIQSTTTPDHKPPLLDSELQRKSDTFLKPPPPTEVDMKKHDEDTSEPSREQSVEDVVGGSDCVNSHKQAFVKSDVHGSGENSHTAQSDVPVLLTQPDKHPPYLTSVPNNCRPTDSTKPTTSYNRLTTSEPPGGTISKQCVDPPLEALEGGRAQAETSGHTPPDSKPDRLDHSVKLSANDDCGNVLSPLQTVALHDTEQELDHPPLQYVPGVGLAEANTSQTTVANGLKTLNNTVCAAADDQPLRVARPSCILAQHTPSVSIVPPPCAIIRILIALIYQTGHLYLPAHASRTHLLHPNILPVANDRPRSQNNPGCILVQQATDSPSISIVSSPYAIIRILTALIHNCFAQAGPHYLPAHANHLLISTAATEETHIANLAKLLVRRRSYSGPQVVYQRERVVDGGGVSSNGVVVPSVSVHCTPLVCEETENPYLGQLTVAVGSCEMELYNPDYILHGTNRQTHLSQNVHTHPHIVGVSHNLGGNLSSFNTLDLMEQQQLGEVELAPPPSAEVEGNEHPPPEDSNVVMAEYNDNTLFHGLRPRYSRAYRDHHTIH